MSHVIEVDDLTKQYPITTGYRRLMPGRSSRARRSAELMRPPALAGVSLTVAAGEAFGLLGQNGAGKTTLIRILTTALLPTSGHASVLGYDVVADAQAIRRRIGVITGEERSFYWRLTGRENLEFFATLAHVDGSRRSARIAELLERVSLAAHADRPVRSYSSGMRQRLGIARGLLASPDVLFMDEPTRSLDPISARDVRALVREHVLGDPTRAVILATHSMVEAESLCDRVAFVRRGSVVAAGPLRELRATIHPGRLVDLLVRGAAPAIETALRLGAHVEDLEVHEEDGLQRVRGVVDDRPGAVDSLLRAVMGSGAEIVDCRITEASLEDLFVRTLDDAAATDEVSVA